MRREAWRASLFTLTTSLAACGSPADDDGTDTGTDSDSSETGEPNVPGKPSLALKFSPIKQFGFAWQPVAEAQGYELFERVDEQAESMQIIADISGETISTTMPLHLRAGASYELRACNELGCTASDPLEVISDMSGAVGYFKPSNPQPDALFGTSLALSADGNTLAVGATLENGGATGIDGDPTDLSADNSGAVYIFVRDQTNGWTQQAYIKASNTEPNDGFGSTLAISGDGSIVAVGTAYEDSAATGIDGNQADNSANMAGAVYAFERDAMGNWAQRAYIKASNTGTNDHFGESLALATDGQTLAVGASDEASSGVGVNPDQTDDSSGGAGAVYVFHRDAVDGWSQQAYLKASNAEGDDYFGRSVALSADGDVLAVGADQESSASSGIDGDPSDNSDPAAGAVYLFARTATTWAQEQYIKSPGGSNEHFGLDLALSAAGDVLLVGDFSPRITVLRRNDGWSDPWGFDGSVAAISGDGAIVAIGRPWDAGGDVGVHGSSNEQPPDGSAPDSGAVEVFAWDGVQWLVRGYVKAPNTEALDRFGTSVALSGDGATLAVGAPNEASMASGIGGDPSDNSFFWSGATYLY